MPLTTEEYEDLMKDAEAKLERLRASYEQYFQGMERVEPNIQKRAAERIFLQLMQEKPRGSTLRFRANQLIQKWSTYQMYWRRVCRQIEEGTFKRHVDKAKKHKEKLEREKAARRSLRSGAKKEDPRMGIELDMDINIELDMKEFEMEVRGSAAAVDDDDDMGVTNRPPPPAPPAEKVAVEAKKSEALPVEPTSDKGKSVYKPPAPKLPAGLGAKPAAPKAPDAATPKAPIAASAPKPAAAKPPPPGVTPLGSAPKPAPLPPVPSKKPAPTPPPPAMSKAPAAPKPPPPAAAPKPAAKPAVGDAEVRSVYDRYVEARKKNNERVDNVKFEKVREQITKMLPDLEKKHQGKRIEFDVVVKDGKVGIKPVAK